MSDCKNCKMTDEYCASGDCPYDTEYGKTLTEKWKNRELESGYYYVIVKEEFSNRIDFYNSSATIWSYHSNDVINQVLAPVPSYEEWKFASEQLNKNGTWYTERSYKELKKEKRLLEICVNSRDNTITDLTQENQKLKELLKECRDVAEFTKTIVNKHKWFDEVITKIDEVLK